MNGPLHLYLADLVGNAKQLVITIDNARIPIDISPEQSGYGGEGSMHSSFTSYNDICCTVSRCGDNSFHSSTCSMSSSSTSSSSSSSSRWSSESSPNPIKEKKPKLPLRRLNSCSPPPSPDAVPRMARRCKSASSTNCFVPSMPSRDDCDHDVDVDACCSSSAAAPQPLCLSAAARGMLRMPQRRASMEDMGGGDGNNKKGGGRRRVQRSRRTLIKDGSGNRKDQGDTRVTSSRNVSEILGEAIRELGLSEEEMEMVERNDPSLARHAREVLLQHQQKALQ